LDWRLGEANIEPAVCESGRQNLAPLVLGLFSEAPIAGSKSSSTSNRDAAVQAVRALLRPSGEWARRLHFGAHRLAPRGFAWLREASRGKKLVKSDSASHVVDDEAGNMEGKTEVCPIL
jgi:hypothetical protein